MIVDDSKLIKDTINFVKSTLKDAEGGHDWFHIERVYRNAMRIAEDEHVNHTVVALAVLLHDIADSKFNDGDETLGPRLARRFLFQQNVDSRIIEHVINIIKHMSFRHTLDSDSGFNSKEMEVVQDADRLDALGAIGIARCFNYGGFKNRVIYDPEIPPDPKLSKSDYKNSASPTINHFYEKLLLLKDQMNTNTGKAIARERHNFMELYLNHFYAEWSGRY